MKLAGLRSQSKPYHIMIVEQKLSCGCEETWECCEDKTNLLSTKLFRSVKAEMQSGIDPSKLLSLSLISVTWWRESADRLIVYNVGRVSWGWHHGSQREPLHYLRPLVVTIAGSLTLLSESQVIPYHVHTSFFDSSQWVFFFQSFDFKAVPKTVNASKMGSECSKPGWIRPGSLRGWKFGPVLAEIAPMRSRDSSSFIVFQNPVQI